MCEMLRLPVETTQENVVALRDASGTTTGWALSLRNPIAEGQTAVGWVDSLPAGVERVIAWSGTLDEEDLFGRGSPLTWMAPGRSALGAFIEAATPLLRDRGVRLLLRPHCRHVLGDATAARSFLEGLAPGTPVGLALDPASLLEPEMMGDALEHCRRAFELVGAMAEAVILTGAAPGEGTGTESVRGVPLGEGVIPAEDLAAMRREFCGGAPVALLDRDFERQAAMLG